MSKKLVILGAGESGAGTAILAKKKGWEVFVSDNGEIKPGYKDVLKKYSIDFEENVHSEDKIMSADEIVKSPGIPDEVKIVERSRSKGIPVISEIEFGYRYTDAKHICVTGSNGKTTTALLTYSIFKKAGLNVGLAGNVGFSYAGQIAENKYDYLILELSSFQLDDMYNFKSDVAILLNITSDHLDRYNNDIQLYSDSKFRITQNQTVKDFFIYCYDDPIIQANLHKIQGNSVNIPFSIRKRLDFGGYADDENMFINLYNNQFTMSLKDITIKGKHNVYNSLAASIASNIFNIRNHEIRECLMDFQGVEHRLEPVLRIHGIEFINDSKATNINSTWYALESVKKKIVWIAGGIDKGNDYSIILNLVREKVKAIVCLGKDNTKLHQAFEDDVDTMVDTQSMKEAVRTAYYLAKQGDVVLLSPACASFDLFENYEDRGWQFKEFVREL
ncbi:UDP-N-acetylmuramoyl-L-alanine--D-glutamate ligase [Bacteroidota bacterium]